MQTPEVPQMPPIWHISVIGVTSTARNELDTPREPTDPICGIEAIDRRGKVSRFARIILDAALRYWVHCGKID